MNAGQKWLQLGLDILLYEVDHTNDGQLLSEGADRLINKHPILGRAFIIAAGVTVTMHLANILDDRYDVMSTQFWNTIRGRHGIQGRP